MDEKTMHDSDGNECSLDALCRREPEWAASRIRTLTAEAQDDESRIALYDLLAVVHRDGGHHTEKVGVAQSVANARARVAETHSGLDEARARAEKAEAKIGDCEGCPPGYGCPACSDWTVADLRGERDSLVKVVVMNNNEAHRQTRKIVELRIRAEKAEARVVSLQADLAQSRGELEEINVSMSGRVHVCGAVGLIDDYFAAVEEAPCEFDSDDFVLSGAVANLRDERDEARGERDRLKDDIDDRDRRVIELASHVVADSESEYHSDLAAKTKEIERLSDRSFGHDKHAAAGVWLHGCEECGALMEKEIAAKTKEAERLRDGLREMLDTEDHAGPVCGHCHGRIGKASLLYNLIRALLADCLAQEGLRAY